MNCIQSPDSPLVVTHKRRHKDKPQNGCDNYPQNSAVYIRNLCKSYGKNEPPTINNLCMNVRNGTIYGLLGASGCGKTTVLSCIVGLKKWDSGDMLVFGEKPGTKASGIPGKRLGYMPQELALYDRLTISEMLRFYGRIYNLRSVEITQRWIFLAKLLQLPPGFKLIANLSGGQKRRASLALALVHCPDLLVLDEPTVGLDPLLRRSIWNHLYKIVSSLNTTVIITTHYIEEARLSNTIGVMRNGRLLVEDTPTTLLHHFQCDLLEDVVLKLCRKDETNLKNLAKSTPTGGNNVTFKSPWNENITNGIVSLDELDGFFRKAVGFDCELSENLRRKEEPRNVSTLQRIRNSTIYQKIYKLYGLSTVMWLTLVRLPVFLLVLLLIPTLQGGLTLLVIGTKARNLNFGIVNNEAIDWESQCFTPHNETSTCDMTLLSCKFLKEISYGDLLHMVPYNSDDEARQAVIEGDVFGYMSFPSNFTEHTMQLIAARQNAENDALEGSRIRTYLDYSEYTRSFFTIKDLFHSYQEYVSRVLGSCQLDKKEAEVPLHYREPVYGNDGENYTEYLIPGVIITCLCGVVSIVTSLIFIADRKQGTLGRAQAAGLTSSDILISYGINQSILVLVQTLIWSLVLYFGFNMVVMGSWILYIVICLLTGLCGAILGILIGILCRDEIESMVFGAFLCPCLFMFGDAVWPSQTMHIFWQTVGKFIPTTLPARSLRSVNIRGVGLTHPLVWPGIAGVLLWTAVFIICSIVAFRRINK